MPEQIRIEDLLPHDQSMVLLDRFISSNEIQLIAEVDIRLIVSFVIL
ncbi:hypothetical protein [Sneathiella glossodoripedis]|nr:hypothetical protein [Sneathiella glossodoripedis]